MIKTRVRSAAWLDVRPGGRSAIIALAIVAVFIVGIAAAGGYYWYSQRDQAGRSFTMQAAALAPADTEMYVGIDITKIGVRPELQQQLAKIVFKNKQLSKFNTELFPEGSNLSLEKDVMPWMSGTYAMYVKFPKKGLDINTSGEGALLCALAGVSDEKLAVSSLEKIFGQVKDSEGQALKYSTKTTEGVTLHVPEKGKGLVWCVDNGRVLMGASEANVQTLLGSRSEGDSLAGKLAFVEAAAAVKNVDGVFVYVDAASITRRLIDSEDYPSEEISALVDSIKFVALGAGYVDGSLQGNGLLAVNKDTYGELGKKLFDERYNIDYDSKLAHPENADFYAGLNLGMVWDWFYNIAGATPKGALVRNVPATKLKEMNIDLDVDILSALSGEIAVSVQGMGEMQGANMVAATAGDQVAPQESLAQLANSTAVLTLGIADKAKFDALLDKIPMVGMMLSECGTEKVNGLTLFMLKKDDPASPGVVISDKQLIIITKNAGEVFKSVGYSQAVAKDGKGQEAKSYSAKGSLANKSKANFEPAAGVLYQNLAKFYQEAAESIKTGDNVNSEALQLAELMAKTYGDQVGWMKVTPDGLQFVISTELKQ